MTQVRTAHDPGLFWVLHTAGPKAIWVLHWTFVHGRIEGYFGFSILGLAPGQTWVLHRPDPRLFGSYIARVCWPGAQDCRPCLADLHTLGLRAGDPRFVGLQTRSPRGCSQAREFAPKAQGWANPVPGVCMLGPQLALAPGGRRWGRRQARVACPTPRPGSPSARCP